MNRMQNSDHNSEHEARLDKLFAAYRAAVPDPELSAAFMPGLWQKIESRRSGNMRVFRRLAQVCVGATLALTVVMGAFVIPHLEKLPVYSASYVDALEADHPNTYVDIFSGDIK
jgi:peptidoglycan biosynthesis protein MviN/MurJ (putative lipid II flippase)